MKTRLLNYYIKTLLTLYTVICNLALRQMYRFMYDYDNFREFTIFPKPKNKEKSMIMPVHYDLRNLETSSKFFPYS